MSEALESKLTNPDMQAVPHALLRAARRAREIARATGTRLIIVEDGMLKALDPDDPWFDQQEHPFSTIHDR
jgi:hypothetical protein